jgi:hypothetical protein
VFSAAEFLPASRSSFSPSQLTITWPSEPVKIVPESAPER